MHTYMWTNVYLCSKHSCHIYKYMHAYICVCAYIYFYMYKDISMFKTFMCTQCVHIEGCAHVRPAHRSMTHSWPLLCNRTNALLFTFPPITDTRIPCWHCCRRARLSTPKTRYGSPYARWCRARSLSCCLSPLWLFFQGSSGHVGFRDVCRCIYLYVYAYICVVTCISIYSKHGDTWPCDTRHRVYLDFFSLILFLSHRFFFLPVPHMCVCVYIHMSIYIYEYMCAYTALHIANVCE